MSVSYFAVTRLQEVSPNGDSSYLATLHILLPQYLVYTVSRSEFPLYFVQEAAHLPCLTREGEREREREKRRARGRTKEEDVYTLNKTIEEKEVGGKYAEEENINTKRTEKSTTTAPCSPRMLRLQLSAPSAFGSWRPVWWSSRAS